MSDGSGEPLESSLLARIDRKCIAARNPIDGYPHTDSTSERRQPKVPCSIAVRIRAIRSQGPRQVVHAQQPGGRRLADLEQVAEVAARVPLAHLARACRVDRLVALGVADRLHLDLAGRRERRAVAAEPRLHHAIELIDAEADGLDEPRRVADPHQVPRAVGRQVVERRGEGRDHLVACLADRETADPVAVEVEVGRAPRALGTQRGVGAALHDPEQRLVGPAVCGTRPAPPNWPSARPPVRTTSGGLGSGGHTSSTIWMSAPSSSCVATAPSGVKRCIEPS